MPLTPDQASINAYRPGQGSADQSDCTPCFGDVTASVLLGAAVVMALKHDQTQVPITLDVGSVLVLRGSARYR